MTEYNRCFEEIAESVRSLLPVRLRHQINIGKLNVCPQGELDNGIIKNHGGSMRVFLSDELNDIKVRSFLAEGLIGGVIEGILKECGMRKMAFPSECITVFFDDDVKGIMIPEDNVKYVSLNVAYICDNREDAENDDRQGH